MEVQCVVEDCAICLQPVTKPDCRLECNHVFCWPCLTYWIVCGGERERGNKTCPTCRQRIKINRRSSPSEQQVNNEARLEIQRRRAPVEVVDLVSDEGESGREDGGRRVGVESGGQQQAIQEIQDNRERQDVVNAQRHYWPSYSRTSPPPGVIPLYITEVAQRGIYARYKTVWSDGQISGEKRSWWLQRCPAEWHRFKRRRHARNQANSVARNRRRRQNH